MMVTTDYLDLSTSRTPTELFDFIRSIKSREMRSNSQWTAKTIEDAYSSGRLSIQIDPAGLAVLLFQDGDILRVYYYAKDSSFLERLKASTDRIAVLDLIGKEPQITVLSNELSRHLSQYACYRRMTCMDLQYTVSGEMDGVELATPADLEEITDMLHDQFDPYTARLPSREVISQRIENEDVFLIRGEDVIAGFIIFDSKGQKAALLDYVITRSQYRKQHVARRIWNYKILKHNESRYYYLWVNENNQAAVRFHESNGFRFDGLVDIIYLISAERE